jgi:hypothetical protein
MSGAFLHCSAKATSRSAGLEETCGRSCPGPDARIRRARRHSDPLALVLPLITAIPRKYLPHFQRFTQITGLQHSTPQVTLNLETISSEGKQGKLSQPE